MHAHAGGGPCDETLKKIEKSRFCKSYDTLTTIQQGEKTQLTKVVSALKRFGDPLQARWDNRGKLLKNQPLEPLRGPFGPLRGPKKTQKSRFFKSYDTLTTIQLGEKTQLTKVVSPLKRFGDPQQARWDNRNFYLKN